MIFRKRKTAQDPKFILHGQTLDIVDTYSYLGIIFFKTNLLQKAIIRSFTRISSENRPSSPYIIKFGVVFLTFKIRLQNFN
jgi:hypothetical protein